MLGVTWVGAGCSLLAGLDRRGDLGALPEVRSAGFHASRSALASPRPTGYVYRAAGSRRLLYTTTPRLRINVRNRGAKSFVITAVCIYRHLPLFYHLFVVCNPVI